MMISGNLLIGGSVRRGNNGAFFGLDAATGEPLEGSFGGATIADLEDAAALALAGFRDLSANLASLEKPLSFEDRRRDRGARRRLNLALHGGNRAAQGQSRK